MSLVGFIQDFTEKYIAYYPHFNHVTGSVLASIFLHELVYQDKYATDPDGVAITDAKWMEILEFSRRELETAREHLEKQNLIVITKKGHPCQNYYKIQKDLIDKLWQKFTETGESVLTRARQKRTQNFKKSPPVTQFVQTEQTGSEEISVCPNGTDYTVQLGQTDAVQVGQTSLSHLDKLSLYIKKDLKNIRNKTNTNAGVGVSNPLDTEGIDQLDQSEPLPDQVDLSIPVKIQDENSSSRTKTASVPGAAKKLSSGKNSGFSEGFLEFYGQYPRKKDRPGAWKTYQKFLKDGVSHEEIMRALEFSQREWIQNETDKTKIPYPQTWLNQMPWLELEDLEAEAIEAPNHPDALEVFYRKYAECAKFCGRDPGTLKEARKAFDAVSLNSNLDRLEEAAIFYFAFKCERENNPMIHKAANFIRLGLWEQMLEIKDGRERDALAIVSTEDSASSPVSLEEYKKQQRLKEMVESVKGVMS